jgi:sugar diacid utilization regulator
MHYVDAASTNAGRAYVEYQQYVVAEADRARRDLLEHLLAGELPARGPLMAAARRFGIDDQTRMLVAVGMPATPDADGDGLVTASAVIARAGLTDSDVLVVVRQSEIVAVPAIGAHGDPARVCERLDDVQARLRQEGIPLVLGVGTIAEGVAELPRAYQEATAALDCVPDDDGGVAALPRMSPFRYLALRADETARRLVDPALRAFLDEDRGRGGVLTATIRAFADADLNLRLAADRLQVHHNTAQYRLSRIEERTGRSPRRVDDLIDLLVAIALDDAAPPRQD